MSLADEGFAGAGGWDLAGRRLGIGCRGVEFMPAARATRAAAGLLTVHDDVLTHRPDGQAAGRIDSPPCQSFSAQGIERGRALRQVLDAIAGGAWQSLDTLAELGASTDPRSALVLAPLHFATAHPYRWLAWEQVPSVLPVWQASARVLRRHGFDVWTGLLNAADYGDPQSRTRAVLLASRDHRMRQPTPTHGEGRLPYVTGAEALGWSLDEVRARTRTEGTYEPDMAGGLPRDAWLFYRPAVTVTSAPLLAPPAYRQPGQSQFSGKGCVELSHVEAGVLQGFPADYPWQGDTKRDLHLQVGNAIPAGLAYASLAVAAGVVEAQPEREPDLFDLLDSL